MFEQEGGWDGFQWINENDKENSIVSFLRKESGGEQLLCVFNFTPRVHTLYRIGVPRGEYHLLLCSDAKEFGGSGYTVKKNAKTFEKPWNDERYSISLVIPPLCAMVYKRKIKPEPEKNPIAKEE